MTVIPTQPDLRRNLFQPGDRVRVAACAPKLCLDPDAHLAIGTVQPYPKDTASIEVVYDGEQEPVVYYVEELDLLQLVEPAAAPEVAADPEPETPAGPDYASSAYRAVVNLAYLTELLDGRHDVSLYVGWDGYRGRETTLHLAPEAALEDAAALAARIGLGDYKAKPYEGDVHHRWTGERHGQRVEVVWVARDAAPVETPAAGE